MVRRVFTVILVLLLLSAVSGCGAKKEDSDPEQNEPIRLICLCETEEEAKEIAEAYGIEFASFDYGVAVFVTEDSFYEVTQRGKGKDLPELEIDDTIELYED